MPQNRTVPPRPKRGVLPLHQALHISPPPRLSALTPCGGGEYSILSQAHKVPLRYAGAPAHNSGCAALLSVVSRKGATLHFLRRSYINTPRWHARIRTPSRGCHLQPAMRHSAFLWPPALFRLSRSGRPPALFRLDCHATCGTVYFSTSCAVFSGFSSFFPHGGGPRFTRSLRSV